MADPIAGQTAICGLGVTEMGKIYGHDSYWFAAEAIKLAVEDAGIDKNDIDGSSEGAERGQVERGRTMVIGQDHDVHIRLRVWFSLLEYAASE